MEEFLESTSTHYSGAEYGMNDGFDEDFDELMNWDRNLTAVPTETVDPSILNEKAPSPEALSPYNIETYSSDPAHNAITSPTKFNQNYHIPVQLSPDSMPMLNSNFTILPLPVQQRQQSPNRNYIPQQYPAPNVNDWAPQFGMQQREPIQQSTDIIVALQQELSNQAYAAGGAYGNSHSLSHQWQAQPPPPPQSSYNYPPQQASYSYQSILPPPVAAPPGNSQPGTFPPISFQNNRTASPRASNPPVVLVANPPVVPVEVPIAPSRAASPASSEASDPPASEADSQAITVKSNVPGNKRTQNIQTFDTSIYYTPLAATPATWGSTNQFAYNPYGELNPAKQYSVEDIMTFICRDNLTLWIQNVPADSGKRYGNIGSDKCRFTHCPDKTRTIRKGDFRVAFDEHHAKKRTTDPFHNAGYVHLYCLEKYIDFPDACRKLRVRPDVRKLREPKNKMSLTRDGASHNSMLDVAQNFIDTAKPWAEFNESKMRPENYYKHTLCYALTKEHLKKQPKHLQKIRLERGGNTIDKHLNNGDWYISGRTQLLDDRKAGLRPTPGAPALRLGSRKRKADDDADAEGEDVLDDNIFDDVDVKPIASLRNKKQRKQ